MRYALHKLLRRAVLPRCVLAASLSLSSMGANASGPVQSLDYGVALFHFYQQDYFDSISELMVGQQQQRLGPHAQGAELLRGGVFRGIEPLGKSPRWLWSGWWRNDGASAE